MANQYDGALKDAILKACQSPDGMQTSKLEGYAVPQIGRMVQKLQSAGLVFRAPTGGKFGRYFDTMQRAQQYAELFSGKPTPGVIVKRRSAWDELTPAVIPDHVERIVLEAPPDRFSPDKGDTSWKSFSAMRPCEYEAPATSCAARAFAGEPA